MKPFLIHLCIAFVLDVCLANANYAIGGWQSGADAAAESTAESFSSENDEFSLNLGVGGVWKLGHLTSVEINFAKPLNADSVLTLETVDGDGVQVDYEKQLKAGSQQASLLIRIGRPASILKATISSNNKLADEAIVDLREHTLGLPWDQPLVLALGGSLGIEQLSRRKADSELATFTTVELEDPAEIPAVWEAYACSDLILRDASDVRFLNALSSRQWDALNKWLQRGGACVVSVEGSLSSDELPEELARLLPGTTFGVSTIRNPSPLETLVATDKPLRAFEALRLDAPIGEAKLVLKDSLGRDVSWWISYPYGHGTIQFIATSLDTPSLAEWQDRKLLWHRIVEPYIGRDVLSRESEKRVGDSSYLGYSDLVGQLRATLDYFPGVRVFPFGQVAATLIALLLIVGPIDYWFSVVWLKRPHLSWYFSGFVSVAACIALAWLYNDARPNELRLNSAQLLDIDPRTGSINGYHWTHVYSAKARTMKVAVKPTKAAMSSTNLRTDWQGLPGKGLGGLESQLSANRGMPGYRILIDDEGGATIDSVAIPTAGTKGFVTSWVNSIETEDKSALTEIVGVNQLSGQFVNPLDVDLMEPVLFYRNWYYPLNSRIPAGGDITISFDTIPKHSARRLNRKRLVDGKELVTPWNPSDRESIDRLLELMMFYKSASGHSYTALTHRYQSELDHSNLLDTRTAVLLARLEQPWVSVETSSEDDVPIVPGFDRVWCRIVLPVTSSD